MEAITLLLMKYPAAMTFLSIVGVLRLINKPLFSMLKLYAMTTPHDSDDKAIEAVEKSKVYLGITYILDYLGSIKVVK